MDTQAAATHYLPPYARSGPPRKPRKMKAPPADAMVCRKRACQIANINVATFDRAWKLGRLVIVRPTNRQRPIMVRWGDVDRLWPPVRRE